MDKNKFDTTFLVEIGFRVRLVKFRMGGDVSNAAQTQPIGRLKKLSKTWKLNVFLCISMAKFENLA